MSKKSSIQSHIIKLSHYEIIKEIGRGGYGIIYLVEHKKTKEQYAAKVHLQGAASANEEDKMIARELGILIRIQAPTIIQFYGFSPKDFRGDNNVTILMKYKSNGSLRQLIEKEERNQSPHEYDNTAKQIILAGIAHGMMTLHSRRVIHRDLKPDNVLLDKNYCPCITDFGLSKILDPDNSKSQSMQGCGTTAYMAPEVLDGNYYGPKADVYSFGILMYEVICGERAFSDEMKKKNFKFISFAAKILNGERPKFKVPIKPSLKKLIERCWSKDPRDRPSFRELFNKLSLSLDDDDSTIEGKLKDILSEKMPHASEEMNEEEENTFDYSYYCLDDIDYDRFIDYVEYITKTNSKSNEDGMQRLIEEQNKRLEEFEQQNRLNQKKIANLEKELAEMKTKIDNLSSFNEIQPTSNQIAYSEQNNSSTVKQPLDPILVKLNEKIQNEKLKEIIIPPVTSIDERAFRYCFSLTRITIPSSVMSIKDNPFTSCGDLSEIIVDANNPKFVAIDGILYTKDVRTLIIYPRDHHSSVIIDNIPLSVTSIGNEAFSYCKSLQHITIPSSVTSIGDRAFYYCESLKQITIPLSVTSIGERAFHCCQSLTQITIPSSVISIGNNPFTICNNIEKLIVDDNNPNFISVDGVLFTKDKQTLICYLNGKTETTYNIPLSVKSIGGYAFNFAKLLTNIIIPSTVTSIGNNAFFNCSSLTQITIPSSVVSIGKNAFSCWVLISKISIPSSVTSIEYPAFGFCPKLKEIIVDPDNHNFISIDGVLFTKDKQTLICYPIGKTETTYRISYSVAIIEQKAFSFCESLNQITIPSSVTIIKESAFEHCQNLKEIVIPSSVVSIGEKAFYCCSLLKLTTVPSSVLAIGDEAFTFCHKLSQSIRDQLENRFGKNVF